MGKFATNKRSVGNAERQYKVTRKDLPLSCPLPKFRLWDSHPKVYLPIEETGREICPYCDAEYILIDEKE